MSRLLVLALLALAACDSAPAEDALEVAPGEFRLNLEGDLRSQASGPARYQLDPDRPTGAGPNAFVRWAEVGLGPRGREVGVLTLYADDDRAVPLEPGTYALDRSSGRFVLQFPLRDRVFSPYQGTITIERATAAEVIGSFEVELSSGVGYNGNLPSLLSQGRGRFHAVLE